MYSSWHTRAPLCSLSAAHGALLCIADAVLLGKISR
jgi:hypothetical protein